MDIQLLRPALAYDYPLSQTKQKVCIDENITPNTISVISNLASGGHVRTPPLLTITRNAATGLSVQALLPKQGTKQCEAEHVIGKTFGNVVGHT